ncbi:lysozyme inhibitor LprI family protein [Paracoccus sp. Z330]|uniref:Lysozyme inhibitor LprI family protein n=1 Tax=Paracoccus onchidii TaxID=3017813 RepID=A0ABT4ZFW2_9RHOB|nr:lysozyme inhibitor LprI family protein [Paracoccus onchidii]MDB6177863.1 lysozyme inhibitor LprI family protein [Paracoccus onchidii]
MIRDRGIAGAAIMVLAALPDVASAQELAVEPTIVDACFAATETRDVDPPCIGRAAEACQNDAPEGHTTLGTSQCLMGERDVWDALLNREYAALRNSLGETNPSAESLLQAQRAWIAFRDADCRYAYDRWHGGSMRVIASADCQMRHTARRTFELRDLQGF